MRFISRYANHTVTVRRGRLQTTADGDRIASDVYPLRAKFRGPQHVFDSAAIQRSENWTDEERLQVETALLTGPDFGRAASHGQGGIYLAPGEEIPAEHADLTISGDVLTEAAESVKTDAVMRCHVSWTTDAGIALCGNPVAEGSDLCETHMAELADAEETPKPKRRERTSA